MQANTWRSIPRSARPSLILAALLLALSLVRPQEVTPADGQPRLHAVTPRTPQDLQELFNHTGEALPLVSAHRGGPQKNRHDGCAVAEERYFRVQ